MNVATAFLFLLLPATRYAGIVIAACVLSFIGIWAEKETGLIVPGFIPSTLHEIVESSSSLAEWKITTGVWALDLMVYTIARTIAIPIL